MSSALPSQFLTLLNCCSRTPPPHRLIGKTSRDNRHNNIQRGADVNRHRRSGVRACGNARAHDTHDAVQPNGDAVAGAAVCGGQDFGRVGVERAVVDVLEVGVSVFEDRMKGVGRL